MLWGVFGDIHSNFSALDAVLKRFVELGVEGHVCCGDIVGYGADVDDVIERVSDLPNLRVVRGNHDLAVLGRMDIAWFNEAARAAVEFTQRTIKPSNLAWLKDLPPRVDSELFTVVHGSPRNPAEEYLVTVQQFHDNCSYYKISPCFVGHSHVPMCFLMKEPVSIVEQGILTDGRKLLAQIGTRCVANSGSVGQPRDHDPRASCGVYDDENRVFTLVRVEYDVAAVQKRMLRVGLPEFLAARLAYGQ
ncbi:metallophosphoesterase family protein [Elusimicrobiota bacterium]